MTKLSFEQACALDEEALLEKLKRDNLSYSLLPSYLPILAGLLLCEALSEINGEQGCNVLSGMHGSVPPPSDSVGWFEFIESNGGAFLYVAIGSDAGMFRKSDDDPLIVFGSEEFLQKAMPYPQWIAKEQFLHETEDHFEAPIATWNRLMGEDVE